MDCVRLGSRTSSKVVHDGWKWSERCASSGRCGGFSSSVAAYTIAAGQCDSERIQVVIARVWRGWTKAENADAYERLLKETVYPKFYNMNGYRGGYVLRQDNGDESEFVTVNLFESLEAVKAVAGPDYEIPMIEPEARRYLSKIEP